MSGGVVRVSADATGIAAVWPEGEVVRIDWTALAHVALVWIPRDDRSFWQDPGYWELQSDTGALLTVYRREARRLRLLDAFERLPGFSRQAAERALREPGRGYTEVWTRPSLRCPRCGEATLVEREQTGDLRSSRLLACPRCGHELALGRIRSVRESAASP
jgi:predicted RNA-binding Zn-ribbon protein involved in translation (DUF1610 family)